MWARRTVLSLTFGLGILLFATLGLAEKLPPKGSLRVNINTATELQLQSLPGVGPSLAEAIILRRPYRKVEDLVRVKGISRDMVRALRPLLTVHDQTGSAPSRRIATENP